MELLLNITKIRKSVQKTKYRCFLDIIKNCQMTLLVMDLTSVSEVWTFVNVYALSSSIVSKSFRDSFLLIFPMRKPSDVVSQ